MTNIISLIVLLSVSIQLVGQNKNQLDEIIISSINSYIEWNKDLVKRKISLMDTSHYYICMDGLPTNFPFVGIQDATFFSLNNLKGVPHSFKKKLKKGIKVLFVDVRLFNNQITIIVKGNGVEYVTNNNINIEIGDWGIYTYEYSCQKKGWELKGIQYGGI